MYNYITIILFRSYDDLNLEILTSMENKINELKNLGKTDGVNLRLGDKHADARQFTDRESAQEWLTFIDNLFFNFPHAGIISEP